MFVVFYMQPPANSSRSHSQSGSTIKTERHLKQTLSSENVTGGKDVSYLAFKAVDVNSISGAPSTQQNTNISNSHGYGATETFGTATSICTLHAVTDLECGNGTVPDKNVKAQDTANISAYTDNNKLATKSETKSDILAPSYSIAEANSNEIQLSKNQTPLSGDFYSPLRGHDNPFQNDGLPIWERQQPQSNETESKTESDYGSPSTPTSAITSLCYLPSHGNNVAHQQQNTYSSSSPDNSQIHGYNYQSLNETPSSPELLAYKHQQVQSRTKCLLHITSKATNSNYFDPTSISVTPPGPVTPPGTSEAIQVLNTIWSLYH